MTGHPLSRQLAQVTLDALKKAGHIVLAPGGSEQVLRDMCELIEPVITRVLPKVNRSPIMGEVSSTFGDEATDEAVEALVSAMRETLLDSDGVEDVFAEDRVIERAIFRTFADTLRAVGPIAEDDEDDRPPISVRLDTLGYVAAAAAKSADDDTLREALDRAAEAAQSELKTFDDETRTAFFRPVDPDPERRLDIEAAIEEELSDLVDLGVVVLPTVEKTLSLSLLSEGKRRALRKRLDDLAQKHLSAPVCPGSWDWSDDKRSLIITFTPLTEPDESMIARAMEAFASDLNASLADLEEAPPTTRSTATAPASARSGPASSELDFAARILRAAAVATAKAPPPAAAAPPSSKKPAAGAAPAADGDRPRGAKKATAKATAKKTKKKEA